MSSSLPHRIDELARKFEETLRASLSHAQRAQELEDAIGEYVLWEPGRKGHAAAHRRLVAVWRREEDDE